MLISNEWPNERICIRVKSILLVRLLFGLRVQTKIHGMFDSLPAVDSVLSRITFSLQINLNDREIFDISMRA